MLFFFLASFSIFTPRHSPLVEVLDSFVHESGSTLTGVHRLLIRKILNFSAMRDSYVCQEKSM